MSVATNIRQGILSIDKDYSEYNFCQELKEIAEINFYYSRSKDHSKGP